MSAPRIAYVGYCRTCGALNGAVAESAGAKEVRNAIASFRRNGLRVDVIDVQAVRDARLSFCDCAKNEDAAFREKRATLSRSDASEPT